MRTVIVLSSIIILALLSVIFIGVLEMKKENELSQKEINGLRKRNISERDSLKTQLAITRDSLLTAFETIRQATKEREASHLRTQKTIENLRKIIFVQHTDSSRNSELINLYPSFKP